MLFLLFIAAQTALPITSPRENALNIPNDILHSVMDFLDFKDSYSLSRAQKWNQVYNPLKRDEINPLRHHDASNSQVLLMLKPNDSSIQEMIKILLRNPTLELIQVIEFIIKNRLDPFILMYQLEPVQMFRMGEILVFMAAKLGQLDMFKDLDQIYNPKGDLSFLLACQEGHLEMVQYLLSSVHDLEPLNFGLCLASREGHSNVVKVLLQDERVDPTYNNYEAAVEAEKNHRDDILSIFYLDSRTDPETLYLTIILSRDISNRLSEMLQFILSVLFFVLFISHTQFL